MNDGGPLKAQLLHFVPPVVPPVITVQPPGPPAQPIVQPTQPTEPSSMPQLNWSHIKPEFTGKPVEDVEAHHLRNNNWMDTHAFQEGANVQRFCLTLVGEARLWHESLRPIALDWNELQNQVIQQYSIF